MSRIDYVDPAATPDRVRKILERFGDKPLNIFRTLAHAETCFRPALRLGSAILTKQTLNHALRELAILHVARLSNAEYEWVQHVAIAQAVGVPDAQIEALEAGDLTAEHFDARERITLAAVTELVEDADVSDATYATLAEHLSPREFIELILAVGFYMMLARVMRATRIDPDPPAGAAVLERAR